MTAALLIDAQVEHARITAVAGADAAELAGWLANHGPATPGVSGAALGWGAGRTWRAEVALQQASLIRHDRLGRAELIIERR